MNDLYEIAICIVMPVVAVLLAWAAHAVFTVELRAQTQAREWMETLHISHKEKHHDHPRPHTAR